MGASLANRRVNFNRTWEPKLYKLFAEIVCSMAGSEYTVKFSCGSYSQSVVKPDGWVCRQYGPYNVFVGEKQGRAARWRRTLHTLAHIASEPVKHDKRYKARLAALEDLFVRFWVEPVEVPSVELAARHLDFLARRCRV